MLAQGVDISLADVDMTLVCGDQLLAFAGNRAEIDAITSTYVLTRP